MTGSDQLSIMVNGPQSRGGGPVVTAAVIFRCTGCQYLVPASNGPIQTNWSCSREGRFIGMTAHVDDSPTTPNWCALRTFAEREAVGVVSELMTRIEQRNMTAIKLARTSPGLHTNERCAHFRIVVPQDKTNVKTCTVVEAQCLVNERSLVDDRMLVHFISYHPSIKNLVLIEFPDDVTPGLSRRNWVECTELVNLPSR